MGTAKSTKLSSDFHTLCDLHALYPLGIDNINNLRKMIVVFCLFVFVAHAQTTSNIEIKSLLSGISNDEPRCG